MIFPIITFVVAITIAIIAAWFSIAGLMAIFAASAIPVAIMAGSLEVGKLVSASWVYRNWKRAPFLLKTYLTIATIVLMFITSMGIFGFLSRAHLEQAAQGQENVARIERIENDILRYEDTIDRTEQKIQKLETEVASDTSNIQEQIDAEQVRMDQAYARIQPAIDDQNAIITSENSSEDVQVYLDQITRVDEKLDLIQQYVSNNQIRELQGLVGVRQDGNYGSQTAAAVDRFRTQQLAEKQRLQGVIDQLRNAVDSDAVIAAREEIRRLRAIAEREVQNSQETIDRLRTQLASSAEIDNTAEIEELLVKVRETETEIGILMDEKFALESEIRKLEAEVGPIKYIAELVYGDTERDTIDDAVRWLIIVFIFVFDPLAVLLLIAANYSFQHRNDGGRQEEIFESLFSKKSHDTNEKTLDNHASISDNEVIVEEQKTMVVVPTIEPTQVNAGKKEYILKENAAKEVSIEDMIRNASPEALDIVKQELEREINTRNEKKLGWLDDLSKK
jgi:peptidoglycan hydrolase-like protein with peptidoglycan-binding domain